MGIVGGRDFGNNATPPTLAADALNNLLNINVTQCSAPGLSVTGSTSTNRFTTSGYSYDSAGNNTGDGLNSYTYDAENRIRSADVGGTYYCYIYDGNGLRVEKATASGSACSSPTAYELYWRSVSGDTIAETDGSGSTTNSSYNEYVFFAGRRIAQSNPSSSTVYYYFADHLGSTRVVTNSSGSACYEADFLPYGYENTPASFSNTCSTNYKFTGYERDTETGLDYAFARYYNQRMGRFQSGDPLGGDITDPQTLNRYTYARNNPVNFTDPTGRFLCGTACPQPPPQDPPDYCFIDPAMCGFDNSSSCSAVGGGGPCPNALTNGYYDIAFAPPSKPAAPQTPACTAAQRAGAQLADALDKASTSTGWLAFASGTAAVLSAAGEGITVGTDTPVTITFVSLTTFFTAASTGTAGSAAALRSFASGNPIAVANFALSQLANVTAAAAASKIPFIKPWAKRIGDLAEQAADLAHQAKEACK